MPEGPAVPDGLRRPRKEKDCCRRVAAHCQLARVGQPGGSTGEFLAEPASQDVRRARRAKFEIPVERSLPPTSERSRRATTAPDARTAGTLGHLAGQASQPCSRHTVGETPSQRHADGTTNAASASRAPTPLGLRSQAILNPLAAPGAKLKHPTRRARLGPQVRLLLLQWQVKATGVSRRRLQSEFRRRRRPCRTARAAVATARAASTSCPRNNARVCGTCSSWPAASSPTP